MSIFHRTGTVLEFRAGALGEEGSDARRVRALRGSPPRGSPQRSDGGARRLVRAPAPPGGVGRRRHGYGGHRLRAPTPGGVGRRRPRRRRRRRPSPAPGGSRIGDVTSARIVRGGLARIEPGRIPSRWARTVRGGVDRVALGSHYASPPRPRPRDSVERTRNYASPARAVPGPGSGCAGPGVGEAGGRGRRTCSRRPGAGPGVVHAIAGLIPIPVPAHPDQVREHVT